MRVGGRGGIFWVKELGRVSSFKVEGKINSGRTELKGTSSIINRVRLLGRYPVNEESLREDKEGRESVANWAFVISRRSRDGERIRGRVMGLLMYKWVREEGSESKEWIKESMSYLEMPINLNCVRPEYQQSENNNNNREREREGMKKIPAGSWLIGWLKRKLTLRFFREWGSLLTGLLKQCPKCKKVRDDGRELTLWLKRYPRVRCFNPGWFSKYKVFN